MKQLLLKLEPIIWFLFGAGLALGTIVMTGFVLIIGLAYYNLPLAIKWIENVVEENREKSIALLSPVTMA